MNKEPIHFLQTDAKWKNISYAVKDEKSTIGTAGCAPTCAAMVIRSLTQSKVTPIITASWALQHGYKAYKQGTFYSYFLPQFKCYNLQCERLNLSNIYGKTDTAARAVHDLIKINLKDGRWIIACMGKGNWTSSGHYVLAWDLNDRTVSIKDPNSVALSRAFADVDLWLSQIKYAWVVIVPQNEEKNEDEDVVEFKDIEIDGSTIQMPTIFKDGVNYVSIRSLAQCLGFQVGSVGSTPVIAPTGLKLMKRTL